MLLARMIVRSGAPLMLVAGGCVAVEPRTEVATVAPNAAFAAMYGARPNERFALPPTDIASVDPCFFRREVAYPRADPPGTPMVDPGNKVLHLMRENGRALRYGVGVGKAGLASSGQARVGRKADWLRWMPTRDRRLAHSAKAISSRSAFDSDLCIFRLRRLRARL